MHDLGFESRHRGVDRLARLLVGGEIVHGDRTRFPLAQGGGAIAHCGVEVRAECLLRAFARAERREHSDEGIRYDIIGGHRGAARQAGGEHAGGIGVPGEERTVGVRIAVTGATDELGVGGLGRERLDC